MGFWASTRDDITIGAYAASNSPFKLRPRPQRSHSQCENQLRQTHPECSVFNRQSLHYWLGQDCRNPNRHQGLRQRDHQLCHASCRPSHRRHGDQRRAAQLSRLQSPDGQLLFERRRNQREWLRLFQALPRSEEHLQLKLQPVRSHHSPVLQDWCLELCRRHELRLLSPLRRPSGH